VVIGWKGNEKLFNQLLKEQANRISKVVIVDPAPEVIEQNLEFLLSRPGVEKKNYNDFEDFVLHGVNDALIESMGTST
jgi:hypothetical protein